MVINPHTKQRLTSFRSTFGAYLCYGVGVKEIIKKFIPDFLLSLYHFSLALIGAFLYQFPSKKITVIGVTGTSGKTSVVELSSLILEEAGFKVASLSSIKFKIDQKEWENKLKMTMPGRFKLQRFLRQAVQAGCKYAVLEVTSEGIKQFRHKFIDFDIVVFTNLSPEHIETHGSFEKYRGAKLQLFKACKKVHIINLDDDNAQYFWKTPAEKKIGYEIKNQNAKIKMKNQNSKSINFVVPSINLLGEFNIYNGVAAICVGLGQGVSLEVCQRALEKVRGVPGRMEIVAELPFKVIIDYAHTPEALEQVYETLGAKLLQGAKLVCVLGACGGGRDKWKRPILGSLAHRYCREVIITNEDPYDEDPMEIIKQVAERAPGAKLILDRREAIRKAISLARSGDIVIITGKGSEPWMCLEHGKKIPWDDRQVVREELRSLAPSN